MKVLVVDDLEINRRLLCAILEGAGHRTLQANDGVEALAALAREAVEAVISDLLMPSMDGFNLCNEIRKDARLCRLPFIAYSSTYTSPTDMKLAESVGADKYIMKPAPEETILGALEEAVQISKSRPASLQDSAFMKTGAHKLYSASVARIDSPGFGLVLVRERQYRPAATRLIAMECDSSAAIDRGTFDRKPGSPTEAQPLGLAEPSVSATPCVRPDAWWTPY